MAGPLLAVDAPSLMYRAFFALPTSIKGTIQGKQARPVNALLGCANQVLWAIERHAPRAVVLCFGAEAALYRKELYPAYHADRPEMPADLELQWRDAPPFFNAFGWPSVGHDTLEADDLLGSYARAEVEAGGEALLFTGDRDMFQCVGDRVRVLFPGGADGPTVIDADVVRERYGVEPSQVPDFIALRGDPSDGLPGAKGIGEKGAAALLREYGDLETLIAKADELKPRAATAMREQAEELRTFKEVATLVYIPVDLPEDKAIDGATAAEAALARGMKRLADRLTQL